MKYKPGDKVRIKSLDWFKANEYSGQGTYDDVLTFLKMTDECCGKEITIDFIFADERGTGYIMKEPETQWRFTDSMIEGLVDEPKEKVIEGLFECDVIEASQLDEHMMRMPTITTPDDIREHVKDTACKVFQEMLIELCPELLGHGAMAVEWENEFRKRLEE